MIADRIKKIRENNDLTQAELAKKLNITRSSVNAWEMGISVPSTQYIVELALFFDVSTDYLLDVDNRDRNMTNLDGLSDREVDIVKGLVKYFKVGY